MEQINTHPCRSIIVPKNLLLMFSAWQNLQGISKSLFNMRHLVDGQYMKYIKQRNQQVLRGLFYSNIMSSVPSFLKGPLDEAVNAMLTGKRISMQSFFTNMAVAFKRFAISM